MNQRCHSTMDFQIAYMYIYRERHTHTHVIALSFLNPCWGIWKNDQFTSSPSMIVYGFRFAHGWCILLLGARKVTYWYAQMPRHPGREVALMCLFLFLFSFFFSFFFLLHLWEKKPFDYKKKISTKSRSCRTFSSLFWSNILSYSSNTLRNFLQVLYQVYWHN